MYSIPSKVVASPYLTSCPIHKNLSVVHWYVWAQTVLCMSLLFYCIMMLSGIVYICMMQGCKVLNSCFMFVYMFVQKVVMLRIKT